MGNLEVFSTKRESIDCSDADTSTPKLLDSAELALQQRIVHGAVRGSFLGNDVAQTESRAVCSERRQQGTVLKVDTFGRVADERSARTDADEFRATSEDLDARLAFGQVGKRAIFLDNDFCDVGEEDLCESFGLVWHETDLAVVWSQRDGIFRHAGNFGSRSRDVDVLCRERLFELRNTIDKDLKRSCTELERVRVPQDDVGVVSRAHEAESMAETSSDGRIGDDRSEREVFGQTKVVRLLGLVEQESRLQDRMVTLHDDRNVVLRVDQGCVL